MGHVIKIVGCVVLALLCVEIPMLTVLSFVYHWSGLVTTCLIVVSFGIACGIFAALMNVEIEE